jgi:hypothetical protein
MALAAKLTFQMKRKSCNKLKTTQVTFIPFGSNWASEGLLFNTNSAIFQLYHGENKLIFNVMMMRSTTLEAVTQTITPLMRLVPIGKVVCEKINCHI